MIEITIGLAIVFGLIIFGWVCIRNAHELSKKETEIYENELKIQAEK